MSVFGVFLSLLLPAFGFVQRRCDEMRLLRQFMLLCPGSVPKSMSTPQKGQRAASIVLTAVVMTATNMSSSA